MRSLNQKMKTNAIAQNVAKRILSVGVSVPIAYVTQGRIKNDP